MTARTFALGLGIALSLALACASEGLKPRTYPTGFHRVSQDEIKTTMGQLAERVRQLDAIMWREGGLRESDHGAVIEILSDMDRLVRSLKQGHKSSHRRIDRAQPWLQRDVTRALLAARRNPPNYYYAGEIAGACEYCHIPRHEPRQPLGLPGDRGEPPREGDVDAP